MKNFLDTHCGLDGRRRQIGTETRINCPDKAAAVLLEGMKKPGQESHIEVISYEPVNDEIIQKVTERFACGYEAVDDSYIIEVTDSEINVFYSTENSMRYAAAAVVRHCEEGIPEGLLYNAPLCGFRAMKVYIPAADQIPYFKEFLDMCMYYGYNTLVLEIGGAMEYKSHPEVNEGWVEYCQIFQEYQGKSIDVQNSMPWHKNSIHWENGGGSFLTQVQLKEIADHCRERGIKIIPEVPSLSHCDYLLTRHHELAENPEDPLADTYCPSNPGSYALLFDLLDEIVELFQPEIVHIGHDEWYTFGLCDQCKGKDPAQLYADDIKKIMDYLKNKGVDTMIWGEKLLNAVIQGGLCFGGAHRVDSKAPVKGKTVEICGKEYPVYKQCDDPEIVDLTCQVTMDVPATYHSIDLVPADLKIMHWYYGLGDGFDEEYHKRKLWCVYGNFSGENIPDWFERMAAGINGVTISNWGMTEKRYLQRNQILFRMVEAASMVWNRSFDYWQVKQNTIAAARELFTYNYRDVVQQPHIEIIHTANLIIPRSYPAFYDGVLMDDDKERLGYYHIVYKDGSSEKVDILLGSNIGYTPSDWDGSEEQLDRIMGFDEFYLGEDGLGITVGYRINMLEATSTCDYVFKDNKVYYRMLLPTDKEVASVTAEIFEQYKDVVYIDSIAVK